MQTGFVKTKNITHVHFDSDKEQEGGTLRGKGKGKAYSPAFEIQR